MNLFTELRRRNVFRVAAAYLVLSWLLLQAAETLGGVLSLPDWAGRLVFLLLAIGFVPALVFAWAFEMTPEGIKRESEVDRERSITAQTGRKLDYFTIAAAVLAVAVVVWDRFAPETPASDVPASVAGAPSLQPAPAMPRADRSIAVLPFANISADEENTYFADGLSEELLNQLAQVPGLRVAGRTSSFTFREKRDLREIGDKLGVANILEGSVRRQGNQVRVTAQLITSSDGSHLWSQSYDRLVEDIFAVQDDIAQRVVAALDIVLDEEARQGMLNAGIRDVDAFTAYHKGKKLFWQAHEHLGDPEAMVFFKESLGFLQQATGRAPDFSQAWLHQADYYAHVMTEPGIETEIRAAALESIRGVLGRALESARDPQRRAFIRVDQVLFSDSWRDLKAAFDAAVAQPDGCAQPNWLELGAVLGYAEALVSVWEAQTRCEPLVFYAYGQLAHVLNRLGRYEESSAVLDGFRSTAGSNAWLIETYAFNHLAAGRLDEARDLLGDLVGPGADREVNARMALLSAINRLDEARELFEAHPNRGLDGRISAEAMMGRRTAANALAAEADLRPGGNVILLIAAAYCACGAPFDLEHTPRFKARLKESGLPWPPKPIIEFPAKDW